MTYPACDKEYKATLGEDLQTLVKALARKGTYKQIADAAFCFPSLKNCLIKKKNLEALCMECNDLCSKKNPSWLRKSGSDDMENGRKGDPIFSFLITCANATVKKKGCYWTPAAVEAGSTLLKSRNMHMNVTEMTMAKPNAMDDAKKRENFSVAKSYTKVL